MPRSRHFTQTIIMTGLALVMLVVLPGCPLLFPTSGTNFTAIDPTDAVVGGTGKVRIKLSSTSTAATIFSLTSSNPAVATIATSASIPAGSLSISVPYTGVTAGVSTIIVTQGDQTRGATITVATSLQLAGIDGPGVSLQVGAGSVILPYLNLRAPAPVVVNLSSDNPDVISVPATVSIPDFTGEGQVPIIGGNAGFATITATLGDSTQSIIVSVQTTPTIKAFGMIESSLLVGSLSSLYINLSTIVAADTTVTLISSNPAVMAVPASVLVPAGNYAPSNISVTALSAGKTILTAQLGASAVSFPVTVAGTPSLSSLYAPSRLQIGAAANFTVQLDQPVAADTPVTISSSNPAVISLPSTLTVPVGGAIAGTSTTAVGLGTTVITMTLGSSVLTSPVTVVAAPSFNGVFSDARLQVGAAGTVFVQFDALPAAAASLTIANSNPAAIGVQSSITINPSSPYVQFPMLALAVGSTNITLSAFGDSRNVTVNAITTPVLTSLFAPTVPRVGGFGTLTVSVDALVANATTITLTQTNAAALTIPATMVIPANLSSASVSIQGLANAATTITATLGASTIQTTVTPTP